MADPGATEVEESMAELRAAVEEKYDFENFGESDMLEMTAEEWEAAFDPDTWITGEALLDRVEADIRGRIAARSVFAVVERAEHEGEDVLLAYSDRGYAIVYPDGSVEGEGTVLRDVKPVVALCSMADYEVPDPPEGELLPDPEAVTGGDGELGNRVMQAVAAVQLLTGAFLLVAPFFLDLGGRGAGLITTITGLGFLVIGGFLLLVVANARLSDRFRAEEYRERLRAAGVGTDGRPDFLPIEDDADDESANG